MIFAELIRDIIFDSYAGTPLPDYLVDWQIRLKISQWEGSTGRSHAMLKNRMESLMTDTIGWIACDFLFSSLREMHHHGINI